jgi:hypothetical protein
MNLTDRVLNYPLPAQLKYFPDHVIYEDGRSILIYQRGSMSYVTGEGLLYGLYNQYRYITLDDDGLPIAKTVGYYDSFHLGSVTINRNNKYVQLPKGFTLSYEGDIIFVNNKLDRFQYYILKDTQHRVLTYEYPTMKVIVSIDQYIKYCRHVQLNHIDYHFGIISESDNINIVIRTVNGKVIDIGLGSITLTNRVDSNGMNIFVSGYPLKLKLTVTDDELFDQINTVDGLIRLYHRFQ